MRTEQLSDVVAAVRHGAQTVRSQLDHLVRVPSISAPGHDPQAVVRSADLAGALLIDNGLEDVQLLTVNDSPPYVFGSYAGPEDAPTVLLYAHHDVQPIPNADQWQSPPFHPEERGGRLYGRGTADDKGGIAVHAGAINAWLSAREDLPVTVKVLIEGEEEIGSPNMAAFLAKHGHLLQADAIVICDAANRRTGWPTLTYLTRGLAEVYVTVSALTASAHSGMSGPVPDALSGLVAALASLKDARGANAVEGLADDARPLSASERELIRELEGAGPGELDSVLLPGVQPIGDPALSFQERMWAQPAVTVIGIDVPRIEEATNQLIASARAKVSIRLAPGQDPERAGALVAGHLRRHVPWGLACETETGASASGWVTDPKGTMFDAARRSLQAAFGREPALVGIGGTLPLLTLFEQALPGAPILITAVADPESRTHGIDESVDLGDLERATLAEALLLGELGDLT